MLTQSNATVPYYQPETAYQIFNRVMFDTDVATGKNSAAGYSTTGPKSAFTQSEVPAQEGQAPCYLWDILETCTGVQKQILRNGTAIVENFILIGYKQANGSVVFYNGTNGGGSGTVSSSPGPASTANSAASSITASGAIGIFLLSAAALMGLQAALF
jgi:carboxypeptidase D